VIRNYFFAIVLPLALLFQQAELVAQPRQKTGNRILVVSGGGARGAWGVGVARSLFEQGGGYRAVFGTSTGSLMAPMILLQQFDSLESYYTHVTQQSIFSKNPFKVRKVNGTVTTELRGFNAIWRLIWGKPTLGETGNLRQLIQQCFRLEDFRALRASANPQLSVHVAVTNMNTGRSEVHSSLDVSDYDEMVNWIWASSNQPVFMSYTVMNGMPYVDGGLREIVPLRAAVNFAIEQKIDTIEVIVNDAWEPQDTTWTVEKNKGYFKGGLMRVLEVYNANTMAYDLRAGALKAQLHDLQVTARGMDTGHLLTVVVYSMPPALAATYRDELGFDQAKMKEFVLRGKEFVKLKQYVDDHTRHVYRPLSGAARP
jgi:NTE family protein